MKTYATPDCIGMILLSAFACMGMGYLFYDSWIAGIFLLPCVPFLFRWYLKWKQRQTRRRMLEELKELLYALSANLKVGYSVEQAWVMAGKDLEILYPQGSPICEEVRAVAAQLHLHVPIEQAVGEFAERADLEDLQSFAQVLRTAKRSGGNLIHMMDKTISVIVEKMEVEQEIQTLLAGKKLEQKIMSGMPVLMLVYLKLTNPLYMEPIYHNGIGRILMTVCLAGAVAAAYWGSRLIRIEV